MGDPDTSPQRARPFLTSPAPPDGWSGRARACLIPSLVFVAAVCWYGMASPYARTDFPLDDAWIHQVYARAFAHGQGFAYNAGQQEAGATSPLWVVVSSPAHWLEPLGVAAVAGAVKGIGVILGWLSVLLLCRIAHLMTRSWPVAAVSGACFACEPRLIFSTLSGMENSLLVCLVLAALLMMLLRRWTAASLFVGLAVVTRPEAVILVGLYFVILFVHRRDGDRPARPSSWVLPLLPFAAWAVFCLYVNGHPLPTTYYLKSRPFRIGVPEASLLWSVFIRRGFTAAPIAFLGAASLAAHFVLGRRPLRAPALLVLVVLPVLYGLAVAGTRAMPPGVYYTERWLDPASLVATGAISVGLGLAFVAAFDAEVAASVLGDTGKRPFVPRAVLLAGCLLMAFSARPFARTSQESRFHLWSDARAIRLINVETGMWVGRNIPAGASIGVNDAGAIRYFGNRRTVDLVGLNDSDIAFKRTSLRDAIGRCDWLAVFPSWFVGADPFAGFQPRLVVSIPVEAYTVCDCPGQSFTVIFEKKIGRAGN